MTSRAGHDGEAPLWGVSAEFDDPQALLAAARVLRDTRLGRLDCFTPVPVAGMAEALRLQPTGMRGYAAVGALVGFLGMFGLCLYATGHDYVFDIGGRPRFSWPYFVVPSVSFAMLAGALAIGVGMLLLNRMPRLNHPAFNMPNALRLTQDRFFLAVEAQDDAFDPAAIEAAMTRLAVPPLHVARVPR